MSMVEGLTIIYQWMWISYGPSEIEGPMGGLPTRRATGRRRMVVREERQASAVLNVHGCDLGTRFKVKNIIKAPIAPPD